MKRRNRGSSSNPKKIKLTAKQSNSSEEDTTVIEDIDFTAYGEYYKTIIGVKEWNEFKKYAQTPLPFTFRINTFIKESSELLKDVIEQYIEKSYGSSSITKPRSIPWYPKGYAWKHDCSVGKVDAFMKGYYKEISKLALDGFLYRQEEVSMLPAYLLDVKPTHMVLDLCAAPGSKTSQTIQLMSSIGKIEGGVIANDSNYKRSFILSDIKHPALAVTNHQGQFFPKELIHLENPDNCSQLRFDRILCDVPCSGDGTTRKLPRNYISLWDGTDALSLHSLQQSILARGLSLLKNNGRLVYSTCSLNPVENEAVVASILNMFPKSLQLIDVADSLKFLKYRQGLSEWDVISKGKRHSEYTMDEGLIQSMFPPSNANNLNLNRCLRLYPHLQDTGGFFVAVFKKLSDIEYDAPLIGTEEQLSKRQLKKRFPEGDMLVYCPPEGIKSLLSTKLSHIPRLYTKKSSLDKPSKLTLCSKGIDLLLQSLGSNKSYSVGKQLRIVSIGEKFCEIGENEFKLNPNTLNISVLKHKPIALSTELLRILLENRTIKLPSKGYGYVVLQSEDYPTLFILCRKKGDILMLCGTDNELRFLKFIASIV